MSDTLIKRIDQYVERLLSDAEAGCSEIPSDDTTQTENGSGSLRASLSERTAILKAVTAYIAMRDKKVVAEKPGDETEDEPGIINLERRINRQRRR